MPRAMDVPPTRPPYSIDSILAISDDYRGYKINFVVYITYYEG